MCSVIFSFMAKSRVFLSHDSEIIEHTHRSLGKMHLHLNPSFVQKSASYMIYYYSFVVVVVFVFMF